MLSNVTQDCDDASRMSDSFGVPVRRGMLLQKTLQELDRRGM